MSGPDYFHDGQAINPYMTGEDPIVVSKAIEEHQAIQSALETAGVTVVKVAPPADCQDGVYTANWALCRGDKALLASLPNARKAEEDYARAVLLSLGKQVLETPYRFSGQGDALPCGDLLFMGSTYRTDPRMNEVIQDALDFTVIGLETIPALDEAGRPLINRVTGWPDSFFYDIDLALSVINPQLIAWCPEAFTQQSQAIMRALDIEKIEVSLAEAKTGFACNLVSTGETVVMSAQAPDLAAALRNRGLNVVTPGITELAKGGGYIRCTTLTLDNS